jgi:aerobic carbon-monoxide dehydrogenase medium subunit
VVIRGAGGPRTVPVEQFMVGVFETALAPGDLVEAVRIPRLSASARWGWYRVCRKSGDFADAIGAVLHDPERGVRRAVIGAIEARPILLAGGFDAGAADAALRAAGRIDPIDRQIHVVALRRAADQAGAA